MAIAPVRFRDDEGHGAEHTLTRGQRHHHPGSEAQRAEHGELLRIPRRTRYVRFRGLGHHGGSAGAEHGRHAAWRGWVEAVSRPSVAHHLVLGGDDVDLSDPPRRPAVLEEIDGASIGEQGDGELHHPVQGGVVVERGSEDRAGVSQERGPTLGVLRELPGGLRQGKEGQPFLVDAAALRHHRGEGQREQRGDAHEGLQQEKRLVEILPDEGAVPVERAPQGHRAENERRGRRLPLAETKGSPHEGRHSEEVDRIAGRSAKERGAEDELADQLQGDEEGGRFEQLEGAPPRPGLGGPEDQEGGHQDVARGIPEPPREPDGARIAPRGEAREDQAAHADGGAYHGADHGGQEEELDHFLAVHEGMPSGGEAPDQVDAEDRFERIAGRDAERCRHGAGRRDIGHEGSDEDAGPHPASQQEQRGQGDSRGRPHRGGAGMHQGQLQPQLGRSHVQGGEQEKDGKIRESPP